MSDWLQSRLGLSPELQVKFLVTLLTVFGLWLLHWIVLSLVYRRGGGPPGRFFWRQSVTHAGLGGGGLLLRRAGVVGGPAPAALLRLLPARVGRAPHEPLPHLAGR